MGVVYTAFTGALVVMVRSSDVARRTALVETELRHLAETVRTAPYVGCATASSYSDTALSTSVGYARDSLVTRPPAGNAGWLWDQPSASSFDVQFPPGPPTNFVSSPAVLHTNSTSSGSGWQARDRCDASMGNQDDNIQYIQLQLSDTGSPSITRQTAVLKRNNGFGG